MEPHPVRWLTVVGSLLLAAVGSGADSGDKIPESVVGATERIVDSVGLVRSAGGNGTGWIARADTVVTNLHVARAGTGDIYVEFPDGALIECFTAVARREMDLAVLRCDTGGRPTIQIDASIPAPGTPVAAVGYPGGRGPSVTFGSITAERRQVRGISTVGFTADIAPGSSGSPVIDGDGGVRAVATFGGGHGVASGELRPLLDRAERLPSTKDGAEWRLRIRRSATVAVVGLPLLFLLARRKGREHPGRSALRWTVALVLIGLGLTQVQFMVSGPAHFI